MPRSFLAALLALVPLALAPAAPASAADLVEVRPAVPLACANTAVLDRVVDNLHYAVTHVPGLPQVGIVGFDDIRLTPYPIAMNEWAGSMVARQYCNATALMSDGHHRHVWYLVEFGMGFASLGNKVESCVEGFDPWHVYDAYCRVLR